MIEFEISQHGTTSERQIKTKPNKIKANRTKQTQHNKQTKQR
jgi:hypothetical protein